MTPLFLALAVLLAAFTQGVAGFGAGLVAMALLPLFMDLKDAVAVVSVLCAVINVAILWQVRAGLALRRVGPMLLGALLGVPTGVSLLRNLDGTWLKGGLGALLLAYAAYSLAQREGTRRTVGDAWGLLAGAAGGTLGGAFNVGGPPAVVYVTLKDWDKDAVKATLQAFFCTISLLQIPLYAASGILRPEHGRLIALGLPTLALGILAGSRVYERIDTATFRRVLLTGIAVMGTVYLFRALTG